LLISQAVEELLVDDLGTGADHVHDCADHHHHGSCPPDLGGDRRASLDDHTGLGARGLPYRRVEQL
jgi:hypothetical protein